MNEVAGGPAPSHRRWGLLEPIVGFVAAQLISALLWSVLLAVSVGRGVATGSAIAAALDGVRASVSTGLPLVMVALAQSPLWATQLATVAWVGRVRGNGVRHELGLVVRPLDVPVGLVAGVMAQGVVSASYQLIERLVPSLDSDATARQISAKGSGLAGVAALVVLFAVIAPIVEELFYRGLLLGALRRHLADRWALVVSAFLFAAIHFEPLLLPGLMVAGLLFGALALRSGRLGPAIFAHIGFNASTILVMTLTR